MDPKSGYIHIDVTPEQIQEKVLIPIPKERLEKVVNMSPAERRAWAKRQLGTKKKRRRVNRSAKAARRTTRNHG